MLISFAVSNSRSFQGEATLSMVRAPRRVTNTDHWDGWEPYSPVAGIYGANASGKSNFLSAIDFWREAVKNSHNAWEAGQSIPMPATFQLGGEHEGAPASFEGTFEVDGVRHQYGFELNSRTIKREWLYAYPKKLQRVLFERDADSAEPWYFGDSLKGQVRVISELTRPNSLFLSAATSNNHKQLGNIHSWIVNKVAFANPYDHEHRLRYSLFLLQNDEAARDNIVSLMQSSDLGISDVEFEYPEVPDAQVQTMLDRMRKEPQFENEDLSEDFVRKIMMQTGAEVAFAHKGARDQSVRLPFADESYGTQTLLGIAGPVYEALQAGRTLVIDEIDTSLHPVLVRAIVRLFKSKTKNPNKAQVIFSSHDVSLLMQDTFDEALLDRDQIWFVDKDESGASHLYPLTEFKPRASHSLLRGYLQGRYGAVPKVDWRSMWSPVLGHDEQATSTV